jgi:hypothetical protein
LQTCVVSSYITNLSKVHSKSSKYPKTKSGKWEISDEVLMCLCKGEVRGEGLGLTTREFYEKDKSNFEGLSAPAIRDYVYSLRILWNAYRSS